MSIIHDDTESNEPGYGPGFLTFIVGGYSQQSEDESVFDCFKQPIRHEDEYENPYWNCGECGERMPMHNTACPVHLAFLESEKHRKAYVRPPNMCEGCDQPVNGTHRFGCHLRGARAQQITLPVSQKSDGTFVVEVIIKDKIT